MENPCYGGAGQGPPPACAPLPPDSGRLRGLRPGGAVQGCVGPESPPGALLVPWKVGLCWPEPPVSAPRGGQPWRLASGLAGAQGGGCSAAPPLPSEAQHPWVLAWGPQGIAGVWSCLCRPHPLQQDGGPAISQAASRLPHLTAQHPSRLSATCSLGPAGPWAPSPAREPGVSWAGAPRSWRGPDRSTSASAQHREPQLHARPVCPSAGQSALLLSRGCQEGLPSPLRSPGPPGESIKFSKQLSTSVHWGKGVGGRLGRTLPRLATGTATPQL